MAFARARLIRALCRFALPLLLIDMAKLYYDLYCDESGTDKNHFYFGAIHCSRARAEHFEREVQKFRARTNMTGELKWTKVSKSKLSVYTEFVDIFLNDLYASFILSEINKGVHWRKLASSRDSQFLQAYFHFVEKAMWSSARYAIFLDETPSKTYKFKSFHYALNLPNIRYKEQKKVHTFRLLDSHQSDLMQLVDVVLGALSSKDAVAPHKVALSNYVKAKIAVSTKFGRPKLISYTWTAPEKRRFRPSV